MGVWNGRRDWLLCANFPGHEGELTRVSGTGIVVDCRRFCHKREPVAAPAEAVASEAVRYINLGHGRAAMVDAADFEWLNQRKWHAPGGTGYATGTIEGRQVLHAPAHHERAAGIARRSHQWQQVGQPAGQSPRVCTAAENAGNRRKVRGTSRFKGVFWNARRAGNGRRSSGAGARRLTWGSSTDEVDAARAYDCKAMELFGEFACLNFPQKIPSSV